MGLKDGSIKDIINKMIAGQWEEVLPRTLYGPLNSWFKKHKDQTLIIRIVIWDPILKFRFACHFVCDYLGDVQRVFLPTENSDASKALGLPGEVYDCPVYCLPNDTFKKALQKKKKSKKLEE